MTTNPPQIVFNHIVAFEVSKETLVVHTLPDDEQCTIDNKPQAVRRLIKAEINRNRNKQLGQILVICEAITAEIDDFRNKICHQQTFR